MSESDCIRSTIGMFQGNFKQYYLIRAWQETVLEIIRWMKSSQFVTPFGLKVTEHEMNKLSSSHQQKGEKVQLDL